DTQAREHFRLNVRGQHSSSWTDTFRQPQTVVAGSRADVGHNAAWGNLECIKDFLRLVSGLSIFSLQPIRSQIAHRRSDHPAFVSFRGEAILGRIKVVGTNACLREKGKEDE